MHGTGGDAKGQPTQTQQHLARLAVAADQKIMVGAAFA